jgi:hypothetical protein
MVLFVCLLEPSVSRWYEVDIQRQIPLSLHNVHQNFATKTLSQSQTMFSGSLFSQNQWLKKSLAASSDISIVFVGTICMSDPKASVIDMMQLYLLSSDSGPIKLIATCSLHLSGMGKG